MARVAVPSNEQPSALGEGGQVRGGDLLATSPQRAGGDAKTVGIVSDLVEPLTTSGLTCGHHDVPTFKRERNV